MTHAKSLSATLLALAGAGLATSPALAAPTASAPVDPLAVTASCIVGQFPQGARMFRASDGSFRVVAFGRRGNWTQWTVSAPDSAVRVVRNRGTAGADRTIVGTCY